MKYLLFSTAYAISVKYKNSIICVALYILSTVYSLAPLPFKTYKMLRTETKAIKPAALPTC